MPATEMGQMLTAFTVNWLRKLIFKIILTGEFI